MKVNPFSLLNTLFGKLDRMISKMFFNLIRRRYEADFGCLQDEENCWVDPEVLFEIEEEAQALKARCYLYLITLMGLACWAISVFKS